ncbi:hypothetical protein, partial [Arcobacter sp. F2176]|uniref:hypothetical protein n=1 Tax=Arcobacter sp. F2176 TaxID=2044511 RepID=UPI001027E545
MEKFEFEEFEDIINTRMFKFNNYGPLKEPITSFKIYRDSDLRIILKSTSSIQAKSNFIEKTQGLVYNNEDKVVLHSYYNKNVEITLFGVTTYSNNINLNSNEQNELSLINTISATLKNEGEEKYMIEWIDNIDSFFIFDQSIIRNKKVHNSLSIDDIVLKDESIKNDSHHCLHILLSDVLSCYLCRSSDSNTKGFILYKNIEEEDIRNKLRNCISFVLGKPLIYLGYSCYNDNSELVSFKTIRGHDYNGAFKLNTQAPTILHSQATNAIDSMIFSNLVSNIYSIYDDIDFRHLSWLYWHASTSAPHSAGVQFGACIESLCTKSLTDNEKKLIIDKTIWKKFRKNIINESIETLEIDKDIKEQLKSKIDILNVLSQKKQLQNFLQKINIKLSTTEENAWQQRNDSAHGNPVKDGNYIKMIREVKILRTLFN